MKYGQITGPYDPLYPEVTRKLRDEVKSPAARWVYIVLVSLFPVEEDWDYDPVWVSVRIRATKTEIAKASRVGRSGFNRLWNQLTDAGLVQERDDGVFVVPFYKKIAYDSISALEVRERFTRLEVFHRADLRGPDGDNGSEYRENRENVPHPEADLPHPEVGPSLFKGFKKQNSLSGNMIISGFYRGIGQKRIAKVKRERALKIFRELRKDGFSLQDIAFAVEWTLENVNAELYDFGIIEHTFGQAMAAREKERKEKSGAEERDKAEEEERARREAEDQERAALEAYKDALTIEQRAELRDEAMANLENSGDYKAALISDPLINAQENDIIRKRLEEER